MAITPIETAAFLPKSQEASFQRQNDVQKPANEQALLQNNQQQKVMADAGRTVMMTKADQPEYRYDGSSGNGYTGLAIFPSLRSDFLGSLYALF